jgi:lysine/ornithine N-monooxygenase
VYLKGDKSLHAFLTNEMFKPENMEWDDAKLLVWVSRSFSCARIGRLMQLQLPVEDRHIAYFILLPGDGSS